MMELRRRLAAVQQAARFNTWFSLIGDFNVALAKAFNKIDILYRPWRLDLPSLSVLP